MINRIFYVQEFECKVEFKEIIRSSPEMKFMHGKACINLNKAFFTKVLSFQAELYKSEYRIFFYLYKERFTVKELYIYSELANQIENYSKILLLEKK